MEAAQSSGSSSWRRLLLTLLLSPLPVLGSYLPMPGIDFTDLPSSVASSPNTSLFALGVTPLLSAYVLVEMVALLVPRLRKLRHGFPDGRARLRRWTVVIALVLAAFQAFGIGMMLNGIQAQAGGGSSAIPLIMLSAVAATGVLALVARAIDGLGLIGGVLALSLASEAAQGPHYFADASLPSGPRGVAIMVGLSALPLVATWAALRHSEQRASNGEVWLGGPLSSLRPVVLGGTLLISMKALAYQLFGGAGPLDAWTSSAHSFEVLLGLGVALTLLFSVLLQWPARVAHVVNAVEQRDPPLTHQHVWKALQKGLPSTLLLTVTLLLAGGLLRGTHLPDYMFTLALLTALVLDGVRAFRMHRALPGLVCVWEERRPYAVPGLVAAAEDAGITLRVSGTAQTSVLRLFGPFAAIGLWCEPSQAVAARALLGHLLLLTSGDESEEFA